jgi:Z1 domain.
MITNGRFYSEIAGSTDKGNDKYSPELRNCIETTAELCFDNLNSESYSPIMMLGSIQSGKTRAFIGLMSLCFDNDFDMTIILTKCSKALVQQTVSRMTSEFDGFRTGNATVGDVVAQDILDIDFRGARNMQDKEDAVDHFLKRYRGKKRIIVVKKQADNVDRMNMFIKLLVSQSLYKRILIVDDEADVTSVGYEKIQEIEGLSLRRISGAINSMRKHLHSNIEHVLLQVTATPYALYLQPESFSDTNIMPIRPDRTVVMPTGDGYIGGRYYFIDSQDKTSENYHKAHYLPHIVDQNEMDIINGSRKNSGKNSLISDGRSVKMDNFLNGQKENPTFAMPSLRSWLFDILVGAAVIQDNPDNEGFYVSAVMHAATTKNLHSKEIEILESSLDIIREAFEEDIKDEDAAFFIEESYQDLSKSVKAYSVLKMPSLSRVRNRIAHKDDNGELEGLITEVDIKAVNSDNDITTLLNVSTGELKLENSITIFVGGQVLDRGITIPNMIGFFYGRDPKTMQQDTVIQHCRMFGYRNEMLLSVTRFYTTYRLFTNMQEITQRDLILRRRMEDQQEGSVIYMEAGGDIKACSPAKVLASKISNVLPEKRYLPVGFELKNKKTCQKAYDTITEIIKMCHGFLPEAKNSWHKGEKISGRYAVIDSDTAFELISTAYGALTAYDDGTCNIIEEIEPAFWFSLSEMIESGHDDIALIVRKNRKLGKMKHNGTMYQDGPDDGNNEGAIAKILRKTMPVLVLTEQTNPEWGKPFWWPVYYTPENMNVGIYAEEAARSGVCEDIRSMLPTPVVISDFKVIDMIGSSDDMIDIMQNTVNSITEYYDSHFAVADAVTSEKKRKTITCPVYLDDSNPLFSFEKIRKQLEKIMSGALNIAESAELDDKDREIISNYFKSAVEFVTTDESREAVLAIINSGGLKQTQSRKLRSFLNETDDLLNNSREVLGYFIPIGSGKCEIHIYMETIKESVIDTFGEDRKSDQTFIEICAATIAHEIFHAIHYADVMTESGRWVYRSRDYLKQGCVQEAMAEYFSLCYGKDVIAKEYSSSKCLDFARDAYKITDYPKDGGYSGAFLIEQKEKNNADGNKNKTYVKIYKEALSDMPKAYQYIELPK